jgi:hypothetical protein
MNGSVAADFGPDRRAQAQTVQTPVQTSHEKYPYLQAGSNPVCALQGCMARAVSLNHAPHTCHDCPH